MHTAPTSSQYHSQDEWGQYAYGYSGGPSAKHEQRTADGVTRGGYSYVDANGIVQSVSYVSDPANGFRATGTNFPVDTAAAPAVVHQPLPVVHQPVPVVHQPVPVVHDVPVPVHPWPAVAEPALLPTVVEARHLQTVPAPHLVKLAKPLTPAGTANLQYPEHAVFLTHRKKRSASHYPCPQVSGYAAPAPPAQVLHHYGATSYSNYVRHHAPAPVAPAVPVVTYSDSKSFVKSTPVAEPEPVDVTVVDTASHVSSTSGVSSDSHVSTSSHVAVAPAPQVYTSSHVVVAPAPQAYTTSHVVVAPAPQVYTVPHVFAAPAPQLYAAPAPQLYAARHVAVAPAPQVYAAPHVAVAPAPQVYAAPHVAVAPVKTQFHAQDEHGQYTYGYTDGASAKTETRYADGMTKGSYSYVDGNGEVQAVHYTAGADGFKAAGTNIPVHHVWSAIIRHTHHGRPHTRWTNNIVLYCRFPSSSSFLIL